jgi:hypothetical protein
MGKPRLEAAAARDWMRLRHVACEAAMMELAAEVACGGLGLCGWRLRGGPDLGLAWAERAAVDAGAGRLLGSRSGGCTCDCLRGCGLEVICVVVWRRGDLFLWDAVELGRGAPPMVVSAVACRLWPAGFLRWPSARRRCGLRVLQSSRRC